MLMVRYLSWLFVVLLLAGPASGCFNALLAGNELPSVLKEQKQSDVRVIAVVGPRSGPYARRFEDILRGVSKAVGKSIKKSTVRILKFDDACSAKGGRAAALKIVASDADVVFGHPCPSAADAVHDIYQNSRFVAFLLGERHGAATDSSVPQQSYVFQIIRKPERSSHLSARILVSMTKGKQIALVHDKTKYSRNLTRQFEGFIRTVSGLEPLVIAIDGAKKDYRAVVEKLIQADVGAVYFAGFEAEARLIIESLEFTQTSIVFVGSDTLVTPSFLKFVEQRKADKLPQGDVEDTSNHVSIGLSVPFSSQSLGVFSKFPKSDDFELQFQITGLEADARAAALIWLASFAASGGGRGETLARAVSQGQFQTPTGKIAFDENGRIERASTGLVIFRLGRWHPIDMKN